jgi:hypothetical protein
MMKNNIEWTELCQEQAPLLEGKTVLAIFPKCGYPAKHCTLEKRWHDGKEMWVWVNGEAIRPFNEASHYTEVNIPNVCHSCYREIKEKK